MITNENLIGLQDAVILDAKEELKKTGALSPLWLFVTTKRNLSAPHSNPIVKRLVGQLSEKDFGGLGPEDIALVRVPGNVPRSILLEFLFLTMAPETKKLLDLLHKVFGMGSGAISPEALQKIQESVAERAGVNYSDVAAELLRSIADSLGAYAVLKTDDAYTLNTKANAAIPHSIAEHPEAKESLISMLDSYGVRRAVVVGYSRESDKDSPVVSFEEPTFLDAANVRFSGRFSELLPTKKQEAPNARS